MILCCVRYSNENPIIEYWILANCLINTITEETFKNLKAFNDMNKLDWTKCVEVRIQKVYKHRRTKAISKSITRLSVKIREVATAFEWHHCAVHWEVLFVNYMKRRAFNSPEVRSLGPPS